MFYNSYHYYIVYVFLKIMTMKDDNMKKKEKVTTQNKIQDDIYLPKPVGAQKQKRHGEEEGGDQMV